MCILISRLSVYPMPWLLQVCCCSISLWAEQSDSFRVFNPAMIAACYSHFFFGFCALISYGVWLAVAAENYEERFPSIERCRKSETVSQFGFFFYFSSSFLRTRLHKRFINEIDMAKRLPFFILNDRNLINISSENEERGLLINFMLLHPSRLHLHHRNDD